MDEKKENKVCIGCRYFDEIDVLGVGECHIYDWVLRDDCRACDEYEERAELCANYYTSQRAN